MGTAAMTEIEQLQQAIRDLHGFKSSHHKSVVVNEMYHGSPLWNGTVEVFQIHGHPRAGFAYAWSYEDDEHRPQYVAVLGIAPVNSAEDAVRAYVVADTVRKSK